MLSNHVRSLPRALGTAGEDYSVKQDKAAARDDTSPSRALSQFVVDNLFLNLADFQSLAV